METETELQETTTHDVELAESCAGCGGALSVRLSPGAVRGVCLRCHLVTGMALVKARQGVAMVQVPLASA